MSSVIMYDEEPEVVLAAKVRWLSTEAVSNGGRPDGRGGIAHWVFTKTV